MKDWTQNDDVDVTGGVGYESLITAGHVGVSGGVVEKRLVAAGRVEGASGVVVKSEPAAGRIKSTAVIGERVNANGRIERI
ncbi:MAG: hypothetical protein ABSH33_16540 [Steroidobacteraceae bacterium]